MRLSVSLSLLSLCIGPALGQVEVFNGPPPNVDRVLDFDQRSLVPGPTVGANPAFAAAGVAYIAVVGPWRDRGVTLKSVGSADGNCLTASGGGLSIAGRAGRVERPLQGAGFEFSLSAPVEEFGFSQAQVLQECYYRIELFSGPASLGVKTATFSPQGCNASGAAYVRGPAKFDRVRLTYTYLPEEVALNRIYLGSGPAKEPPLPEDSVETAFTGHLGGSLDRTFMFDVDANTPIEVRRLRSQLAAAKGAPVSIELYTVPGTYRSHVSDGSAWNLASRDNGSTLAGGAYEPTLIEFADPIVLPAGTTGVAVVVQGAGHVYSYSDGFNDVQESESGAFRITMGTASNGVFGSPSLGPRVWSGRLCAAAADTGSSYCSPGVPNSTGSPSNLCAVGGASLADNRLRLIAESVPPGAFGVFLVSRVQDLVVQPGGSAGRLCLGGAVGRYVAPGQVQTATGNGTMSLSLDLTSIPQPLGSVGGAPGDIWFFQAWHRDSVAGSSGSNFTNGLEVTLE